MLVGATLRRFHARYDRVLFRATRWRRLQERSGYIDERLVLMLQRGWTMMNTASDKTYDNDACGTNEERISSWQRIGTIGLWHDSVSYAGARVACDYAGTRSTGR